MFVMFNNKTRKKLCRKNTLISSCKNSQLKLDTLYNFYVQLTKPQGGDCNNQQYKGSSDTLWGRKGAVEVYYSSSAI